MGPASSDTGISFLAPGTVARAVRQHHNDFRIFRFGPPVGDRPTLCTGADTVTIVSVMPMSFRFPTGSEEVWRPLDLDGWPSNTATSQRGTTSHRANTRNCRAAVTQRRDTIALAVDERFRHQQMRLRSMAEARGNAKAATLFTLLLGAQDACC